MLKISPLPVQDVEGLETALAAGMSALKEKYFSDFEVICPNCGGEGGALGENNAEIPCAECKGRGLIVSDHGRKLLNFISAHLHELS
jgi:DnaJ-class molecular chaperone